jgi:ribonuclease HI
MRILIITDSEYAHDCTSNIPIRLIASLDFSPPIASRAEDTQHLGITKYCTKWSINGWKRSNNKPVLNQPIIKYAWALYNERMHTGQHVRAMRLHEL